MIASYITILLAEAGACIRGELPKAATLNQVVRSCFTIQYCLPALKSPQVF
jgi:hypothetical protein